jgi:DNA-binding CsgD family transcriptional regulator
MGEKLVVEIMEKSNRIQNLDNLTPVQKNVFGLVMWGYGPSQIAATLEVSPSAVSHTLRRIVNKASQPSQR